jgi:hypothetical protein
MGSAGCSFEKNKERSDTRLEARLEARIDDQDWNIDDYGTHIDGQDRKIDMLIPEKN